MDNYKYFYISGFISLSLFSLFASLMLFTLFSSSKLNVFALKKDTYISISIKPYKVKKTVIKKVKKTIVAKPKNDIIEPKDVSIDDLFSDVWTKKIKKSKKKKKINNKRLLEIQKKSKILDKNSSKSTLDEADKKAMQNDTKDAKNDSTANEVNEYNAKIYAMVYKYFNPPAGSVGNTVIAYIKLDAIGKVLDFRILQYSPNKALNKECDKVGARLVNVLFPINPKHKSYTLTVKLTPKE